jgi:hypothetical protein
MNMKVCPRNRSSAAVAVGALALAASMVVATPAFGSTHHVRPATTEDTKCVNIDFIGGENTGNSYVKILAQNCSGKVPVRAWEICLDRGNRYRNYLRSVGHSSGSVQPDQLHCQGCPGRVGMAVREVRHLVQRLWRRIDLTPGDRSASNIGP